MNKDTHYTALQEALNKLEAASLHGIKWTELEEGERGCMLTLTDMGLAHVGCLPETGEAVFFYRYGVTSIPEENAVEERRQRDDRRYKPADIFLAAVTAVNLVILLCQLAGWR